MTLAEEIRRKYALTSLRAKREQWVLMAINEALEAAAEVADQEKSAVAASRIRSLKWTEHVASPLPVSGVLRATRPA
jgi:hypothetical protein